MRASLRSLALGTLLLGSLSACSVNYYVGGTRYAAPAPQPGYDYDYPAPQPGPVVVGPAPTAPPIRHNPPVRTPPVRTPQPPIRHNPQPSTPPANPGNGTLPTAPPKPIPGPVKQPEVLPTAPPKPIPGPVKQPDLLPTAPPKPIPGPTRQPEVLPTAPPKPIPTKNPDLLPTAPPKPIPGRTETPSQQPTSEAPPVKQPDLLPTAPPKPIPTRSEPAASQPAPGPDKQPDLLPTAPPKPVRDQPIKAEPVKEPEVLPTAPPKPIPANAEQPSESPASQPPAEASPSKRGDVGAVETPQGTNNGAPAQSAGAPVFVFRKTPCLGFCPHFEASIYADGRVHYVGHSHVANEGTHELQLPAEVVREMMRQADEIGFSNFKDRYMSGATDMPSTYLTYNRPGQPGKTVQVEEGAPAELMALLTYINKEIERIGGGNSADR